jgi:hypothetical protein
MFKPPVVLILDLHMYVLVAAPFSVGLHSPREVVSNAGGPCSCLDIFNRWSDLSHPITHFHDVTCSDLVDA